MNALIDRTTASPPAHPWLGLIGWLAVCFVAAAIGGVASIHAPDFYAQLAQPSWAPPAWLFGPVWSVLYLLMAISAWLVWRDRGWRGGSFELGLFVVQLGLNALWTWLFFAWHLGALAFAEILLLWLLIVVTLVAFWGVRRIAGALLLPYLAWVSFATALCFAMWQNNPAALG